MNWTTKLNVVAATFVNVCVLGNHRRRGVSNALLMLALCWIAMPQDASATWIATTQIANSQTDWDTALTTGVIGVPDQGALGWLYGYYATDNAPASFTQLATYNGVSNRWEPTIDPNTGPRVARDSMHPGFSAPFANRWAARRWTSMTEGEVRIFGSTGRSAPHASSDGVTVRFYLNGAQLIPEAIPVPGNNITPLFFDFNLILEVGDILDFVVDDNSNPSFDTTLFQVQITQDQVMIPEPASLTILGLGVVLLLGRRRRFSKS